MLESGNAFFGFNFAWDEDIKEVLFFFFGKVGIEPMEHLYPDFVGFRNLCLPTRGGYLCGVGAIVEEGTLDIVDLCQRVHVRLAQVVVGHYGTAEDGNDDGASKKHLGFGVLVMFGKTNQ